jgi:hypothetical protein
VSFTNSGASTLINEPNVRLWIPTDGNVEGVGIADGMKSTVKYRISVSAKVKGGIATPKVPTSINARSI